VNRSFSLASLEVVGIMTLDEWNKIVGKTETVETESKNYTKLQVHLRKPEAVRPSALNTAGLMCCAKTRAGHACKQRAVYSSGRCKFHGGMSTGPKTEAGKANSSRNGKYGRRGNPIKQMESNKNLIAKTAMDSNQHPL
jgi:hypothetical protein